MTVVVDGTLVAVDSGRSPLLCAAVASNCPPLTFRYAQFGIFVPAGISIGYSPIDIWVQLELQDDHVRYELF